MFDRIITTYDADRIRDLQKDEVLSDTLRPSYHFASPCNLLIDVWGGIYHNGYYHLFYDNNVNNDPDRMGGCFGHLRSRDLVHFEDLPYALVPEEDKGEQGLNDGFVVIDNQNKPLMYYTRCFFDSERNREHIAVRGSSDLLKWERIDGSEITMENHGGPHFKMSWSDVVIFEEAGRTFMIISKCTTVDGRDMIPIYEAADGSLLKWEYRGVFAEHTGEVINFIKIGGKWVLIYSPYNNPVYFVGDFNINTYKFTYEKTGVLSYGYVSQGWKKDVSRGFYATSSFYGKDGIPYIIGWISGFAAPKKWDGAVSVARTLSLAPDNTLIMSPAKELLKLRRSEKRLTAGFNTAPRSYEAEITVELKKDGFIKLFSDGSFTLTVSGGKAVFNEIEMPYAFGETVNIRAFIDVGVAEIFFDGGKASITRCFPELHENAGLNIETDGKIRFAVLYEMGNVK